MQIVEETEETLKAVSLQNQEAGRFPLKQVCRSRRPPTGMQGCCGGALSCPLPAHDAGLSHATLPAASVTPALPAGLTPFPLTSVAPGNLACPP